MTKAQFDILIRDQDVVLSENGGFHFHPGGYEYVGRNLNILHEISMPFDLGDSLYNILNKSFIWYVELGVDEFKERVSIRLNDLVDSEKNEYLKELLKKEFLKVDEIIEKKQLGFLHIEELKNWWHLLIENEHLLSIIEYLKFYQLQGEMIPEKWNDDFDFHLLENYFISDNLKLAYEAMEIEKRISYLRELEQEMQNPVEMLPDQRINSSISTDNIFSKGMPVEFAKDHFKVFTESKSKNGKPFLSPEQFNNFIERAFFGRKNIQKETINCATKEKFFIISRFHKFYLEGSNKYEFTTQCRPKYIKLLSENFTNWEYNQIAPNFSKKTSRKWP